MKIIARLAPFAAAAALVAIAPAAAVTNLIVNGSFENGFNGFSHKHIPASEPAVIIDYNSTATYGAGGAWGEAVAPDSSQSVSPDAAGGHAAYFLANLATGESLQQLTYLQTGYYEIGFSAYLPKNGMLNVNDAAFSALIIQVPLTSFTLSTGTAATWTNYTGVAHVLVAGYYQTSFAFTSFGNPAKDVVIDRVYVVSTDRRDSTADLSDPSGVPEPATWGLMFAGFTMVGFSMRRRSKSVAA